MNIYKEILKKNIPKLLGLYNTDTQSPLYGFGDRLYWGWKVSDFPNATLQGGVHSLAVCIKLGLLERDEYTMNLIGSAVEAAARMTSENGSAAEAFPNENSFCVTALVAFDILSAIYYLENILQADKKRRYLEIVRPMIQFISKNGEEHAVISNHLATGVAAVRLWNRLSGSSLGRDRELLQIIYQNQSEEGWYKEYEGPDPGYQTLCTYYLAMAYSVQPDPELLESLKKSAEFLQFFVHTDGTIGGLYGARNTEVFYPGGIVSLSDKSEVFASAASALSPDGADLSQHVLPDSIDIGNYIPLLNSYAFAAVEYERNSELILKTEYMLPCRKTGEWKFSDSGIFIYSNSEYICYINYHKGGTVKVFSRKTGKADAEDGGLFGKLKDGSRFSTQVMDRSQSFENREVKCDFYKINDSQPNPLNFIVLRIFSLTVFKSVYLGNLFKKFIVSMLMTGKRHLDGYAQRKFVFSEKEIRVIET
ncbi:MAG TPA: hypothetical protein PL163_13240, partial [Leptospiraceae bacterium]|nr:hypothetical protein [Leptospiraceae bacterium]